MSFRTQGGAVCLAFAVALTGITVNAQQSLDDFQRLMPITGTVETSSGDFSLDHGFPTSETAERIYDLMDHQRAAQLYLWGLPLAGMAQWRTSYEANYPDFADGTLVKVTSFEGRRGVLTANETTDYFFGFTNTRDAAAVLEVPAGVVVGMIVDSWQRSPSDVGVFGPNGGSGGTHAIVGPNTPADAVPDARDLTVHRTATDHVFILMRMIGAPEEVDTLAQQVRFYKHGEEPALKLIDDGGKFSQQYPPRGVAYWDLLHSAIDDEVVAERDRLFMYWLKTLGIEKGKRFEPTERQERILEDGAKVGELMAKTLVFNERLEGVLRQNDWRLILGGAWGDGMNASQSTRYYDLFDPRARYTYEAVTTSPRMTNPQPGKGQGYIGKFETEDGERLQGGNNYVIAIEGDVPAELFWSIVVYDTDTRTIIDNRAGVAGGKATVSSKMEGLRQNTDGSYFMLLSPDGPPRGWEANHVQTIPGRGWFPYMRFYGPQSAFFDDSYPFPTITRVEDFSEMIE